MFSLSIFLNIGLLQPGDLSDGDADEIVSVDEAEEFLDQFDVVTLLLHGHHDHVRGLGNLSHVDGDLLHQRMRVVVVGPDDSANLKVLLHVQGDGDQFVAWHSYGDLHVSVTLLPHALTDNTVVEDLAVRPFPDFDKLGLMIAWNVEAISPDDSDNHS